MNESGIITAICNYLQLLENQNKILFFRNNSGATQTASGGFIRFGKRGSPDIFVFIKGGKIIQLEVKCGKNKQTVSQLEWELKMKQLGHIYKIVRSIDEVEEIIKNYL